MDFIGEINKLRKSKNAIILAHFYQESDIQEIADYVGDSLGLAQQAVNTEADMIIFAGVHFMAETAKILNPKKTVLIPDIEAGCSLADGCSKEEFEKFLRNYPDHKVVSYINCTADIKTLSDVICTSGNAVQIVESFPKDEKLIFVPDKNLGNYVNSVTGRNMVLWDGSCEVHDLIKAETIINMKIKNPDAKVIAHPECKASILELADFIGSTTAMLKFTQMDSSEKYIVATESGILHEMRKKSPEKIFFVVSKDTTCNCNNCPYMKLITLEKLYNTIKKETHEIELSQLVIEKARKPIEKMLEISVNLGLIKK